MAWNFADGFDLYATAQNGADMITGYWDSSGGGSFSMGLAGRFSGSRALNPPNGASGSLTKASNVNDAVHHIACSFIHTTAISGSSPGLCFVLFDGATAQCTIVFRSDGAILLYSGGLTSGSPSGSILATYTGAFTTQNVWYGFEFEVAINNATGSFAVRKNGNNANDFTATALNTRASANNYANKLQLGGGSAGNSDLCDDFFWQSGASTGSWLGELRCATMMPASDQSVAFSRTPTSYVQGLALSVTTAVVAGRGQYTPFTAAYDGTVSTVTVPMSAGYTGNMKCSIFASSGSAPTTVLGSATPIANPATGTNTFTFGTPITVAKGTQYWIGLCSDTGSGTWNSTAPNIGTFSTTAYASFPAASPSVTTGGSQIVSSWTIAIGTNNCLINEAQEDGLTSYVYDSNPGDADFYGLNALVPAGASVRAATTRAYMQKSDVGTRTAAVQLKSGGTTVAAPTLTLTTSGWLWDWRTDLVDPNTSAAWTAAAVNAAQIGPTVIA